MAKEVPMRRRTTIILLVLLVLVAVFAVLFVPRLSKKQEIAEPMYWPTQSWQTSMPELQGMDSAKLADGLLEMQVKDIQVDSVLVVRNGSLLLDAYYYPYNNQIPHDLASVTKSVMTTLIGIAIDQGKLQLDQPMLSFFSNRTTNNLDARKQRITIRHLVSNVNGFDSGCLSGDEPTLDKMRSHPDWVQAALDRVMVSEPGSKFCYDSPGMHLLSAILQQATGLTALEFAQQNLFDPLGIQGAIWETDPQGYTHGWGDLHLKPPDVAKIGFLMLHNGMWDGRQIVSMDWVEQATRSQNKTGEDDDYGYGWWVSEDAYSAMGRGGQRIAVIPYLNAILVVTAHGAEYDLVSSYLGAALVDTENPLPENPQAVAMLNDAIAAVAESSTTQLTMPMPDEARLYLGKTYVFESNSASVETLSLEINDPTVATLQFKASDQLELTNWVIGLGGEYLVDRDGNALRGYWLDSQTFAFEIFGIGVIHFQLHFDGDRVEVTSPEYGYSFTGQVQNP
jgi:CubicO group peptidase (beta-lactamase class C family)